MNRPVITISDQFMREMLQTARPYCLIILRSGQRWGVADAERCLAELVRTAVSFPRRRRGTWKEEACR
jgi:hypothetical protein